MLKGGEAYLIQHEKVSWEIGSKKWDTKHVLGLDTNQSVTCNTCNINKYRA
jgi:hypothetical protein